MQDLEHWVSLEGWQQLLPEISSTAALLLLCKYTTGAFPKIPKPLQPERTLLIFFFGLSKLSLNITKKQGKKEVL